MIRWFSAGLALVLALLGAAATARTPAASAGARENAADVLDNLRQHGYASPLQALQRLQQAQPPAPDAPLVDRWRYQSAITTYAVRLKQTAIVAAARAELTRLAEHEACEPCRTELSLRELQRAVLDGDAERVRSLLGPLDAAKPPADAELRADWLSERADGYDALGEYDRAIALALEAADLAASAGLPALQAITFNQLVRSNSGRRDLPRALQLAREGYAFARGIGFTYLMVLLRANEGYVRATMNLPNDPERGAALYDTLHMARATPGLEQVELTSLINLSNYHNDRHEYAQGARWGAEAEAAALRLHDPESRAFAQVDRGVALVYLGQVDKGLAMVREGVAYTKQHGLKLESADLLAQLVDAADQAGRPREALDALRELMALRESLTRTQRDKDVLQLQERYATERKTREIERLQLENARRAAEAAAHQSALRGWAATAVAVTLAALMLAQWLARTRRRAVALEADNAKLSEQSSHDPLTGAFNRRHCERLMAHMEEVAMKRNGAIGLIVIDVDFFKKVNDTLGHAAGDAVLVEMVRRLQALLREQDAVVRWGGEEFVVVLPGTKADALPLVAARVLTSIGERPFALPEGGQLGVQVSGGAIAWPAFDGQHWEDALHLADLALYLSKSEGRNRITCLTAVQPQAELDRVRRDLRAARDAGDVTLQTVPGPDASGAPLALVPAAA